MPSTDVLLGEARTPERSNQTVQITSSPGQRDEWIMPAAARRGHLGNIAYFLRILTRYILL